MGRVEVVIMVAAARQDVWDVVSDVHRPQDWVTIHRGIDQADDGPVCEGFTMVQRLELNGADFTVDWTAVSVDEPGLLRWEGTGPGGAEAVTEYRLASVNGGTRFRYSNDFDAPGGILGSVVETVLVGDVPEEEAAASLERLKRLLEG
jgi:carbon monoxide dehydrogenase subunit G